MFVFFHTGYDRNVNADATNAFATAAFRFGHSQVGDFIRFANKHFTTSVDKKMSKVSYLASKYILLYFIFKIYFLIGGTQVTCTTHQTE